jgi:hypothetical protein
MTRVLHVPQGHPLNRVSEPLRRKFVAAQSNLIDMEFRTASELFERVCDDLKVKLTPPSVLKDEAVQTFSDRAHKDLMTFFSDVLKRNDVPEQAIRLQAANLAHRVQLVRAFSQADQVVSDTCDKVNAIIGDFPATAEQIQCGKNPGDVLDPYILAAAQELMCAGDFEATISATVGHKVLMMIEGLLGHLHEDVMGAMRGNVRAPEPRGEDQELLDPATNPFPGADIVQPPLGKRRPLRFHQVKSKTGSAKGGDARRLGLQLEALRGIYGGQVFYDALIGNTLRGHRSMAGVVKAAPGVVVLVGEAAFRELTDSANGPQFLLRLYQAAFDVAAQRSGFQIQNVVAAIHATFKQKADEHGEEFLETILRDAVSGPPAQQDSRQITAPRDRRRGG